MTDIPESDIPLVITDVSLEKILLVAHKKYALVPEEERAGNSPGHPFLLDPAQLQGLPFVAPSPANGMYLSFQKMIAQYKIQPGHILAIDTMTVGLMMVEQGLDVQLISAGMSAMSVWRNRRVSEKEKSKFPEDI